MTSNAGSRPWGNHDAEPESVDLQEAGVDRPLHLRRRLLAGQRPFDNWRRRIGSMTTLERRQTPRMAVEGLAYVNLEPDNGGIVLNISEGGLCFQSTIPVQEPSTIRFWFAQQHPRIDGRVARTNEGESTRSTSRFIESECELSWTNEKRRIGGLRFTNMPPGAQEQIRDWINQHATQVEIADKPPPPPPLKTAHPNVKLPEINAARLGAIARPTHSMNRFAAWRLRGFSGGLVAGVLATGILSAAIFLTSHRSAFGDSLIRLGQRFGGKALQESVPPKPQPASPEPRVETPPAIPAPQPERTFSEPAVVATKPHVQKFETLMPKMAPPPTAAAVLPAAIPRVPAKAAPSSPTVSPPSAPALAPAPLDASSGTHAVAVAKTESEIKPTIQIEHFKGPDTGSSWEKYLEVGKFNDRLWTTKTTEQLSQLGFHTAVIQKGAFWKKSFHVLVGPYGSDQDAEAAHKNLAARGYTPRSFERGSRDFTLLPGLKVDANFIPAGLCTISWESYMPDAFVKFKDYRGGAVTVEGKWVKRDGRHDQNAIVYRKNIDGSRTLLELRFSGREQALVFGKGNI